MRRMSSDQIRESYLSFFESRGHKVLPGANLIPINDPSLLLIGAGMAPFKPYFTGKETPPSPRVVAVQRCIRTPDMERVGKTGRHGTSFEMLGNFSFGDYFKREAIGWAWEYLLKELELPEDKLYITVHRDDDEAYAIWRDEIGVPVERIYRFGDEDNFWEIGVGPCGPCSEIFIDRGPEYGCDKPDCGMGCDCDRYLEIWNLVFTQYDKDKDGKLTPLSRRCIDTGMGLDRVAMVLQETHSLTEIDLHMPLLQYLIDLSGVAYDGKSRESIALRVICDHLKGVVFMIGDGILPGNERSNYVLKRLLRRAVRYGRLVGITRPFMAEGAKKLIETHRVGYPELETKADFILQVIDSEERRFNETLEAGLHLVSQRIEELKQKSQTLLDGEVAFQLHDTFGFPLELTQELLEESGLHLDIDGFYAAMQRQRDLARQARGEIDAMGVGRSGLGRFISSFLGYEEMSMEAQVIGIWRDSQQLEEAGPEEEVEIVLDRTPFYAEGGGQVGDTGVVLHNGEALQVLGTTKESGAILHRIKLGSQKLQVAATVQATVDMERRKAISRHHSATHLLHFALRKELGEHAHQAGSLVNEHRLRFDFNHFQALTAEQLRSIEDEVNAMILEDAAVFIRETSMDEATAMGATALFDEKYGDKVRVVRIGSSIELCGGCHVQRSGQIGLFHIISETSIGSGLRRIEAVAGTELVQLLRDTEGLLNESAELLKTRGTELPGKIQELQKQLRELEREMERLKSASVQQTTEGLLGLARQVGGVPVVIARLDGSDAGSLRQAADFLREKLGTGIVFLASLSDDKIHLLAAATKDLSAKVHSGNLLKTVAGMLGGKGGGRPDLAQGGTSAEAKDKLDETLTKVAELIEEQLKA